MEFLRMLFPGRQNLVFDFDAMVTSLYRKSQEVQLAFQILALVCKVLPSFRQKHYYDHGIICTHMLQFFPERMKEAYELVDLRHVVTCGIHFFQQVETLLKKRKKGF